MKRIIYHKLLAWKNKTDKAPLIIKGARQVGKTYSIIDFAKTNYNNYHYFNFESDPKLKNIFEADLKPKRILDELSFSVNKIIDVKNDLIVFDEIQYSPKTLSSLKYFNEELPDLNIICAGSLLGLYLGTSSFPVGKVEFIDMYPMSFLEFLEAMEEKSCLAYLNSINISNIKDKISEVLHEKLWNLLKIYFIVGGLPKIVNTFVDNKGVLLNAFNMARIAQNNLITSYIADMAKHSGKTNSMHIERTWRYIGAQLEKEHDASVPKFTFTNILEKNNRYSVFRGPIDWLCLCGLVLKCPIVNTARIPLSAYVKENIFKLFFFDVGLLSCIMNLDVKTILDYNYGSYKGYFAENFVLQELQFLNKTLYSWKESTSELEFLIEKDSEIVPIEVKSAWRTQTKSLDVFINKYKPNKALVLSANNFNVNKSKIHVPIYAIPKLDSFL